MRIYGIVYACVALATINSAAAQDVCGGILSYTGRDIVSEARENSIAAEIYSQHCEGSSASRSSSTTVGLEAVVKAIPVKFNFGGSSAQEKLNNFCKTYTSRRSEFSSEQIDRSTVVRESLSAFNQCVELSTKGIYFNPKIGRTIVVVDVRRGSDDASIVGVRYDSDLLTCHLPPTASGGAIVADKDIVKVLDGNYLPITCDRKPVVRSSGEKVYPRAEVAVTTSRGTFLMPIAADSLMPEQWASQIQDTLKNMADELERLRKPRQLECKVRVGELSARDRFPVGRAEMTEDEKKAGYQVTGGGCEQIHPDNNFAFVQGRPDGDRRWICQNGDLPGQPQNVQNRAYVVFCRLPEPK